MEHIRITTQELKARQEEWVAIAGRAESAFLAASDTAEKLENCFSCQMARSLKKDFSGVRNEGEQSFKALKGHLEKLSTIAVGYEEAERSNTGVITDN